MAETSLLFSKIVATPTPTAWSQAYSAGRLFAAISLQTGTIPEAGGEHLNVLGKDLISTLESEFFTLETKDLESIKQAINTTIARIKEGIKISFIVCYLNDNVLYLFATGGGKAVLKRGDKIGTVLQGEDSAEVKSASGYVQEGDIIVLQTKPFQRIISSSTLASSLDNENPEEIAETLAPHVHDKAEGGASSVILIYKKGRLRDIPPVSLASNGKTTDEQSQETSEVGKNEEGVIPVVDIDDDDAEIKESDSIEAPEIPPLNQETKAPGKIPEPIIDDIGREESEEKTKLPSETAFSSPFLTDQVPKKRRMSMSFSLGFLKKLPGGLPRRLSHSRKIILTVAIVLAVLIATTSFLALKNKDSSSNKALFAGIYEEAKTKFDEGQNLKDLNTALAQESFREAKRILDSNRDKFKKGSEEEIKISALLGNINNELSQVSNGETVAVKEVESSASDLLSYEINNSKASYFAENDDKVFFLDGTGVSEIDKGNDKKTQVIKKDWEEDGGIGLFGANVYVLDKKDGILKLVPSGSTYSKSNYFPSEAPDLTDAQAMGIDGSVFILFKNGTIDKYTKGKKDTFSISGLEKPLSSPTRIFTNEDADNVYILDNGNSRIVVLDKTGKFVSAYSGAVIKSAKDLDVDEGGKKVYILSNDKVYQIDLK